MYENIRVPPPPPPTWASIGNNISSMHPYYDQDAPIATHLQNHSVIFSLVYHVPYVN